MVLDVTRSAQRQYGSAGSSTSGSTRQQTRTPRGSRCTPRTSSGATPAADGSAVILGKPVQGTKRIRLLGKVFSCWL